MWQWALTSPGISVAPSPSTTAAPRRDSFWPFLATFSMRLPWTDTSPRKGLLLVPS